MDSDIDLGPWPIGDHYHHNISTMDWIPLYVEDDMLPPFTLLNGKGFFDCSTIPNDTHCIGGTRYFDTTFKKGTKYKIGVIGSMTQLPRIFWIDGHMITVIQMDLVPIEPYVTDALVIGTGQCRYSSVLCLLT